jgi:hypothetical protein
VTQQKKKAIMRREGILVTGSYKQSVMVFLAQNLDIVFTGETWLYLSGYNSAQSSIIPRQNYEIAL